MNKLEKFADDIDVSNPVWSSMPSFHQFPISVMLSASAVENELIQM